MTATREQTTALQQPGRVVLGPLPYDPEDPVQQIGFDPRTQPDIRRFFPPVVPTMQDLALPPSANNTVPTRRSTVIVRRSKPDTSVDLSRKLWTVFPEQHPPLQEVIRLNLAHNALISFPPFRLNAPLLQNLNLNDNRLQALLPNITTLVALRTLNLSENQLTELPNEICELTNLQELYLDENQLTQLPENLGRLQSLKTLILNRNGLTQLPDSICSLENLAILQASRNVLIILPNDLGNLPLDQLDLRDNQLWSLPDSIDELPVDCEILLTQNPVYAQWHTWLALRSRAYAATREKENVLNTPEPNLPFEEFAALTIHAGHEETKTATDPRKRAVVRSFTGPVKKRTRKN